MYNDVINVSLYLYFVRQEAERLIQLYTKGPTDAFVVVVENNLSNDQEGLTCWIYFNNLLL